MNPRILSTLAVTGLALMGAQSAVAQVVKIDGSSTVYPITEAVAEDFQKAKKNSVRVTVGISGTGGGFKKFCRGETDVSNASRPILKKEMDACKELGIAYVAFSPLGRAQIGQQGRGHGARQNPGEVQDADAVQRTGGRFFGGFRHEVPAVDLKRCLHAAQNMNQWKIFISHSLDSKN